MKRLEDDQTSFIMKPYSALNVLNLDDSFLQDVYHLFHMKGLANIVFEELGRLLVFLAVAIFGIGCLGVLMQPHTFTDYSSFLEFYIKTVPLFVFKNKWLYIPILLIGIFMAARAYRTTSRFMDIRKFYKECLKLDPSRMDCIRWRQDVLTRMIQLQIEKPDLFRYHKYPLDLHIIYNMILRHDNYMIGLMNSGKLSTYFPFPFIGNIHLYPQKFYDTLKYVLFGNSWPCGVFKHLKKSSAEEDFNIIALTRKLRSSLLLTSLFLFLASFPLFCYQLLNKLCYYGVKARIQGMGNLVSYRYWSPGACLVLQHYNELPHQLELRLNQAATPAEDYLANFPNYLYRLFKPLCKVMGIILLSFFLLLVFHGDHYVNQGVLVSFGFLYLLYFLQGMVPDKKPSGQSLTRLMREIRQNLVYILPEWEQKVRDDNIRRELDAMIPYKLWNIFGEVLSPFLTPWLLFCLRKYAQYITEYIVENTVQTSFGPILEDANFNNTKLPDRYEDLSLWGVKRYHSVFNFSLLHSHWQPSHKAQEVVEKIRDSYEHRNEESNNLATTSSMAPSFHDMVIEGEGQESNLHQLLQQQPFMSKPQVHRGPSRSRFSVVSLSGVSNSESTTTYLTIPPDSADEELLNSDSPPKLGYSGGEVI